jgi:hypothetical protein
MSPPDGRCVTQEVKSGSEERVGACHVGDITSRPAETPLWITCPRRGPEPPAITAKTPKNGLEITAGRRAVIESSSHGGQSDHGGADSGEVVFLCIANTRRELPLLPHRARTADVTTRPITPRRVDDRCSASVDGIMLSDEQARETLSGPPFGEGRAILGDEQLTCAELDVAGCVLAAHRG